MQPLALPDFYTWSVWQPDRNVYFNSHFIRRPDGNVLIDPLTASAEDVAQIEGMGGVATIVVTNRDHERKSRDFAARFGARIAASADDSPLLSGPVDRVLRDGDEIFEGAIVIGLTGLKSPGEFAIHFPRHAAALVGDALWGDPAGSLRLLPDSKLLDPKLAVFSLRKLWELRLRTMLVGDGASVFGDADRIIGEYLFSREGVFVNRINFDEMVADRFDDLDGKYRAVTYEAGLPIGARKLGYRFVTLEPGTKFCPMHSHVVEEEMVLVWDGAPTIRTPQGEFECRRGDVIAFPVGHAGTHQLKNLSAKPATLFVLGNEEANEIALYPDSKKVLVAHRPHRLMLRTEPDLDYYDGE
jgi:uncharacterized cupin superfamily protein